jgi:hypothetical protein
VSVSDTRARIVWAVAFAGAAAAAAVLMWGFTVDDALISIRYASHLAAGLGYRFNADGPPTDGVTPLPWPFVLAALAHGPALAVLARVKALDVVLAAGAAALLGARAAREGAAARFTALAALATCLPLAAWSASGMETPLATLLCTACVFHMDRPVAAVFAGLAAAVRPELLPWAATVSCGLALARRDSPARVALAAAASGAPFLACALVRRAFFGRFAPLAVLAKPSDLAHGAVYAVAALVACAVPVLVLAPLAARALPRTHKAVLAAFGVHVLAVIAAGGDSMPYARLFVPVLPSLLFVHLAIARAGTGVAFWVRTCLALGLAGWFAVVAAPRGRHVMRDRAALVARAAPVLRGDRRIAAVDIGWVSALPSAPHVVDLAGLTDPEIAALPGGHTSKHVDGAMLLDRRVDAIVLYVDPMPDGYRHAVGAHLARDPLVVSHFPRRTLLPLGERGAGYVVLER